MAVGAAPFSGPRALTRGSSVTLPSVELWRPASSTQQQPACWGLECMVRACLTNHAVPAVPAAQVRGPHTVGKYFNSNAAAADADGWFDTGDVATIDPLGHMQVTRCSLLNAAFPAFAMCVLACQLAPSLCAPSAWHTYVNTPADHRPKQGRHQVGGRVDQFDRD